MNRDDGDRQNHDLSQAKQTPMQRELQAQVGEYIRKEAELQKRLEEQIFKKR